mgnify:CR=1 FL=1
MMAREKPTPEYTVFYRRHAIGSYRSGAEAMARIDFLDPDYRVWVRVEDRAWLVWPNPDNRRKERAA